MVIGTIFVGIDLYSFTVTAALRIAMMEYINYVSVNFEPIIISNGCGIVIRDWHTIFVFIMLNKQIASNALHQYFENIYLHILLHLLSLQSDFWLLFLMMLHGAEQPPWESGPNHDGPSFSTTPRGPESPHWPTRCPGAQAVEGLAEDGGWWLEWWLITVPNNG